MIDNEYIHYLSFKQYKRIKLYVKRNLLQGNKEVGWGPVRVQQIGIVTPVFVAILGPRLFEGAWFSASPTFT